MKGHLQIPSFVLWVNDSVERFCSSTHHNQIPDIVLDGDWTPHVFKSGFISAPSYVYIPHSPIYQIEYEINFCYHHIGVSCSDNSAYYPPIVGNIHREYEVVVL